MEPVFHVSLAGQSFCLSDLVVVVYRDVIDATGMDIDLAPEELEDHRGALDMPARKPGAPGGIPFLLAGAALRRELPEREVMRVVLFRILCDPSAILKAREVYAAKLPIAGKTV